MSFKRDGDDKSLLNVLRKRRIQDLFSENIPENEAEILSNGKFICTVCHYKPVFDTIEVLTQHRNGKKHLENVKRSEEKLKKLEKLIEIRKQKEILKNKRLPILSSQVPRNSSRLLNNSPYDARASKTKLKIHERKPTIHLYDEASSKTTDTSCLGGAKIPFCRMKNSSTSTQKDELTRESDKPLMPYTKQRIETKSEQTSAQSLEEKKNLSSNKNKNQNVYKIENSSKRLKTEKTTDFQLKKTEWKEFNANSIGMKKKCPKLIPNSCRSNKSSVAGNTEKKMADDSRKDLAFKYWQIAGSGWKKDWSGKWEKDDQAEFDSDEEAPNLP